MSDESAQNFSRFDWMALVSITGSVAISVGIWMGLLSLIEHFVK